MTVWGTPVNPLPSAVLPTYLSAAPSTPFAESVKFEFMKEQEL